MMVAWRSRGDLLRWWRSDVRGLTQQQAADQLCVQASALSNWERGTRAIPADLTQIDRALAGGQVLADLLRAHGTPQGLKPDRSWSKVFPGPSGPVWMWLRSPSSSISLAAEWGVASLEIEMELGANGVFLTLPVSVHDSPVIVRLSKPGWVDFGRGELPPGVPDASVIEAVNHFRPSSADGTFMQLFVSSMIGKMSTRSRDIVQVARLAPRQVARFFAALSSGTAPDPPPIPPPSVHDRDKGLDRLGFAQLRQARGLSLMEVAEILSAETDLEVSRDTLRRFESGIGTPHERMLPAGLDHVLGAEGHLAALDIRSASGDGAVSVPCYWRGPVWIEIEGRAETPDLTLQRGKWHREVEAPGRVLLSFHWFDPAVPLRIRAPANVRWTFGIGRRAAAESIDQNWAPGTFDVAQEAISQTELAITTALTDVSDVGDDWSGPEG